LAGRLAASIDYANFKDEVHRHADQGNKSGAYLAIWSAMMNVQDGARPEPPPMSLPRRLPKRTKPTKRKSAKKRSRRKH
jgi:hypothetical protein